MSKRPATVNIKISGATDPHVLAALVKSALSPAQPDYEYKIGPLVCYDHLTALEYQTSLAASGLPTEILRRVVGHWKLYKEEA